MRQVPKNKEEEKDQQAYRDSDSRSRSEEHTSELQSQSNLVCRLLLEKKKNNDNSNDQRSIWQIVAQYQSLRPPYRSCARVKSTHHECVETISAVDQSYAVHCVMTHSH